MEKVKWVPQLQYELLKNFSICLYLVFKVISPHISLSDQRAAHLVYPDKQGSNIFSLSIDYSIMFASIAVLLQKKY